MRDLFCPGQPCKPKAILFDHGPVLHLEFEKVSVGEQCERITKAWTGSQVCLGYPKCSREMPHVCHIAIENSHLVCWFAYEKWWFSIVNYVSLPEAIWRHWLREDTKRMASQIIRKMWGILRKNPGNYDEKPAVAHWISWNKESWRWCLLFLQVWLVVHKSSHQVLPSRPCLPLSCSQVLLVVLLILCRNKHMVSSCSKLFDKLHGALILICLAFIQWLVGQTHPKILLIAST